MSRFVRRTGPQLVRWESRFGWTRTGFGAVSGRETSLASVLARLLPDPDAWVACADEYLKALDRLSQVEPSRAKRAYGYDSAGYERKRRAGDLAEWHGMLLERLADYEAADRLAQLAAHPAFAGAESLLFQARLTWWNGEKEPARRLVGEALTELPGHEELHVFAAEIGAPLPARAQGAARRFSC